MRSIFMIIMCLMAWPVMAGQGLPETLSVALDKAIATEDEETFEAMQEKLIGIFPQYRQQITNYGQAQNAITPHVTTGLLDIYDDSEMTSAAVQALARELNAIEPAAGIE